MSEDRLSLAATTEGRLAWVLVHKREALMARWTKRVLDDPEVPDANRLAEPALLDHIPTLVVKLLARLMRHPSEEWGERVGREVGGSDVGVAHAQQRFSLHFTLTEALRELSHFRAALLELCEECTVVMAVEEAKLVHATIDELMATSAGELERYALAEHEQAMAIVAHDLRNPLSFIAMHAARIEEGVPVDGPVVGAALRRASGQMQRLIDDLLELSKLGAGHLSVHAVASDLRAVTHGVVEQLRHAATRKRVSLEVATPPREVAVVCDPDRVAQALGNVVSNAIRFTPGGGRVRVELDGSGEQALLRVTDTGPGVKAEHVVNIFRAFWRAPGAAQGVGLGLAIARGIVEAHGGAITVDSARGGGATFCIALPFNPVLASGTAPPDTSQR